MIHTAPNVQQSGTHFYDHIFSHCTTIFGILIHTQFYILLTHVFLKKMVQVY